MGMDGVNQAHETMALVSRVNPVSRTATKRATVDP